MEYAIVIVFIRSLTEGIKAALPALFEDERVTKALVFVFSFITVLAYKLNALAEVGKPSQWLWFDYAITIVAVAVASMTTHDILATLRGAGQGGEPKAAQP